MGDRMGVRMIRPDSDLAISRNYGMSSTENIVRLSQFSTASERAATPRRSRDLPGVTTHCYKARPCWLSISGKPHSARRHGSTVALVLAPDC